MTKLIEFLNGLLAAPTDKIILILMFSLSVLLIIRECKSLIF